MNTIEAHVKVTIDLAELAKMPQETSTAILQGVAKVIAANRQQSKAKQATKPEA